MNLEDIKGIIVPMLTPIDEQENIDEPRLRFITNHVIEDGVHGILLFGSNGEFYMFDEAEMEKALKITVEETAGRVPVYFGIGSIRTKQAVRLAKMAEANGADSISILPPMFLKPTYIELRLHFETIANAVNVPVLIYNNPGKVGYNLSADFVEDLARSVDNIVGIKDSSGDFTLLQEYIRRLQDTNFKVLSGKDTLIYAGLCVGSAGAVCSTANMFGPLVNSIYNEYVAGNYKQALENQFKLNPVRLSQDKASFPVATKDMANLLGLDVGKSVLPSINSEGQILEDMKAEMEKAGLLNLSKA